jgi:Ribonuclease G/E
MTKTCPICEGAGVVPRVETEVLKVARTRKNDNKEDKAEA